MGPRHLAGVQVEAISPSVQPCSRIERISSANSGESRDATSRFDAPSATRARDLQLLRRQLPKRARVARARRLARSAQFAGGAVRPQAEAERLERLERSAQPGARVGLALQAAQVLTETQLGARALERYRGPRVQAERLLEPPDRGRGVRRERATPRELRQKRAAA